jgi:GntR family transcriptional regulator/MocR family aminotransferase
MDYQFLLTGRTHTVPVSRQRRLYNNLRAAIVTARFVAHHRLPSSRELAQQLGIARNTIIHAYEQLSMEGYLSADRRGTFVAKVAVPIVNKPTPGIPVALSRRIRALPRRPASGDGLLPFTPGVPALDEFPLQEWHRTLRRACVSLKSIDLGYGDARGNILLRTAISDRLRAARGVRCTPDQVLITNGTQSTLDLLARTLADIGDTAWLESPGYRGARNAFAAAGLAVRSVSVDQEGMNFDNLRELRKPRLIYVTPSHQYPLGSVLSLRRRMDLINFAWRCGAQILEDDYDSDFRFGGEPLPSLQGLVEDAPVFYLGTFSKTMFPGMRLGYLVVSPAAVDSIASIYSALDSHGRQMEQVALAHFMMDGRYTRHLNRMRRLYRERHRVLREALSQQLPDFSVEGGETGLHLVLRLPNHADDVEIVRRAARHGLNPHALSLYTNEAMPRLSGLVLGYGNLAVAQVCRHVRVLASLCNLKSSRRSPIRP